MAVYYNTTKIRDLKTRELIDTIMDITNGHSHTGTDSKLVVGGTVSDDAVTNAKLGTDVKVGSIAALTTTTKASVVAAINELDGDVGALSGLSTVVKTSVVNSINELDSDIGSLASLNTTVKSSLVGAINEVNTAQAANISATGVQTLTNKTLTAPIVTNLLVDDSDAGVTVTSADQTNAAATVTIPDIGDAADTFAMIDTQQTLTNKILTTPVISTFYKDAAKTKLMTVPDVASDTVSLLAAEQTLTNKTLTTPVVASIYQDAGKTKLLTIPNTASDTLAAIAATQTLTNKTLTAPVITYTASAHDYVAGSADWTLSAGELKTTVLKPTNANAPVNAIIADTAYQLYIVVNGTGQALTVKTAAGTGISIANAKTAIVMSDGVNVIRVTTDA